MVQSKKVIALIVATLCTRAFGAEAKWWSAGAEGYEVVTDAGAGTAAKMALRTAHMRELLGGPVKTLPLRVVLLQSEGLFSRLRPSATAGGYYQSSADADWIVVQWGRPDSERALSHEMVHAFLEHKGPRRPLWLEEGLAEFYSTAALEGGAWTIGRPIPAHVQILNRSAWLGEREFFEAAPDSALRDEGSRVGRFYAQSWAVVHYLLTTPGVREKTPALFSALSDGIAFARACESVMGQRQGMLLEMARQSVERGRFVTARIRAGAAGADGGPATAMVEEAVNRVLVDAALAAEKPDVAQQFAQAPQQKGLLALAAGDREAAERWFREAVAAGSREAAPYFELAMLLREAKREPAQVEELLRKAIVRNPNHAEAHFLLGLRAAANGDREGAVEYYQTAARILPRQATFWHALALELSRAGRLAEAGHAAVRCRQAARNGAEREMAAALEHLVAGERRPAAAPASKVYVPESWQGLRGDAEASGRLVSFDCMGQPPVAHVVAGNERLALRVAQPDAIRISGTGAARHTFVCGDQDVAVRVEFKRETKELTAIEFR